MSNIPVRLPEELKKKLASMSEETDLPQSVLIRMATYSLVVNYEQKGSFIFADLLNPDHKT